MVNPLESPTSDDKLWAGLGYAGLVCCMIPTVVIFLLKKDESNFIKFHNLQALGIGLASLIINVVLVTMSATPGIGFLFGLVQILFSIAFLGYWIYLMIQGFTGKDVQIPVLGDYIHENLMK